MEKQSVFKALVAEFIGTFALVFTIILVVAMYALQGDIARGLTYPFIAVAHFLILFLMIQTVGSISGGHFNPAVTLALLALRRISGGNALGYMVVQVLGAIAAALLAMLLFEGEAKTVNYAATSVSGDISIGAGMVLEALMTFFLVWAVVGTAINPDGPREWAPMAIAATLALGVLLIAPLTGAGINPARSIGPALISGKWGSFTDFVLPYVVGPLVGGLLGALLYSGLFMSAGRSTKASPAPSEASPL